MKQHIIQETTFTRTTFVLPQKSMPVRSVRAAIYDNDDNNDNNDDANTDNNHNDNNDNNDNNNDNSDNNDIDNSRPCRDPARSIIIIIISSSSSRSSSRRRRRRRSSSISRLYGEGVRRDGRPKKACEKLEIDRYLDK